MCFLRISEQTAIISLYSINGLVFITETGRVYCAVRTGCLNTIQINCDVKGKKEYIATWSLIMNANANNLPTFLFPFCIASNYIM